MCHRVSDWRQRSCPTRYPPATSHITPSHRPPLTLNVIDEPCRLHAALSAPQLGAAPRHTAHTVGRAHLHPGHVGAALRSHAWKPTRATHRTNQHRTCQPRHSLMSSFVRPAKLCGTHAVCQTPSVLYKLPALWSLSSRDTSNIQSLQMACNTQVQAESHIQHM